MKRLFTLICLLFALAIAAQAQFAPPVSPRASAPTLATLQSAAVANGNGTLLTVNGQATAALTVNCSSCSGGTTVNFEASEDGTNFVSVFATQVGTSTIATSTTTAGITVWEIALSGLRELRARVSAYSAGTVTVTGRTHAVGSAQKVVNANVLASGTAITATGSSLNINCTGGCGAPAAFTDNSAFTAGTSSVANQGAVFNDGLAAVTSGNAAAPRITAQRALHANLRTNGGVEVPFPATLGANGGLKIEGVASGTAVPISGTVTANAGSGTFTISGTVTANAGTNLNTSALALESGGNLAIIAGAVRAEDSASADLHTGIGTLAIRKATPANTSGTDGDYEFLQMSAGRVWASATIDAALPAGTNVIGHVINDSGSTTAVTGNVTVVQPTNASLKADVTSNAANISTETTVGKLTQTQGSTTSGQSGPLVQGAVTTSAPGYTTAQTSPLSLTTAGALRVDNSAVTQPVSGTVTANQGGTWTVQPGNTANTTAWKVDGSAVTQPVSGTFFQATQPISGTVTANAGSGTFTTDPSDRAARLVGQVEGRAASGAAKAGNPQQIGSVFNTTQPTVTTGQVVEAQATARGGQIVATGVDTFNVTVNTALPTGANTIGAVTGTLADNGAAAGTNRVGTTPGIAQTSYNNGTASTQGRNVGQNMGTDGLLWTAQLPAIRPASFTASAAFAGSSTTDNSRLPGNATNTVLVTKVIVSCTQTTAGILTLTINKRSTAGSGGTSANITVVPDDSNYAAGVSVPVSYTGTGPTVGTLVGALDNIKLGCMATGTASPNDIYILNLSQKPIVLRGTAENLTVNFGGAITGGNITVTYKWIETATISP